MTDEEYDEWFSSLPELYQKMIKEGAVWMAAKIDAALLKEAIEMRESEKKNE